MIVGIDLGTTHSVVASSPADRADVRVWPVPQLVAPGEVAPRRLFPSVVYLPLDGPPVAGEHAHRQGARAPGRCVVSAKSWLVHGGVNRRAAVLPWGAPDDAPHLSPLDATRLILEHLRRAWDEAHPRAPLAEQEVIVTVPASFDSVARELTVEAARAAGLGEPLLLEEPQAAFYDFLGERESELGGARLILVVDVGGGTTDLTLVRRAGEDLERVAVGGHLMLGGDNMDATLAHRVKGEVELDPTEWAALVHSAREAKELLLGSDPPDEAVVTLQRRGSRLVGGTRSVPLRRDDAHRLLLDGFFPFSAPDEVATRRGRAGLTTLGLPYVTDPAVPRHVCAFLRQHVQAARQAGARVLDGLPRPDVLLLNGGVFNAPAIVERFGRVLEGWYGEPVPMLSHGSLDTAVARGAVRFGLARRGLGTAVTGGAARAYFLGIEGAAGERQALCIAPRGMDEGSTVELRDRVLDLLVDRPVAFPLYCSTGEGGRRAGELATVDDELDALPPVRTVVRGRGQGATEPVWLSATLTESGTLELYLVTLELPPSRWRLAFALGPEESAPAQEAAEPDALPEAFRAAVALLDKVFAAEAGSAAVPRALGRKARQQAVPQSPPARSLRREVEAVLGPRGAWSSVTCRALWDQLHERRAHRALTGLHEQTWLRLVGWCLRPGFGAPGDPQRLKAMEEVYAAGVQQAADKLAWAEWWVLWRRVAPGLDRAWQKRLFDDAVARSEAAAERIRLLAVLERVSPEDKVVAAELYDRQARKVGSWWPLGRLGARQPFHGSAADVVPTAVAEAWLDRLLEHDWDKDAAFAAALLARKTGDPARDVGEARRRKVLQRLKAADAPFTWLQMVREPTTLGDQDAGSMFGDALPVGLRLVE